MVKITLSALSLLFFGAVVILFLGRQPEAFPHGSDAESLLARQPYDVSRQNLLLIDTSRRTQNNNEYQGSEHRSLETSYWYPLNDRGEVPEGKHPLIVYSHGFTSSRESGRHLAEHLAGNGYIVIATNFPLTTNDAPGGPEVKDVVNQPGDVSFLIDTVIAWSENEQHVLFGHLDTNRIGATGISLGGFTTTLVSYHPTQRDSRIKAAASIAGPSSSLSEKFYQTADIPFLMLAADTDAIVPYPVHALPILNRTPRSTLVTITGGTHLGFAAHTGILRWLDNADSVGCYAVLGNIDPAEEPWHDLVGSPEQGVLYEDVPLPCATHPQPVSINPLRQQMATLVTIFSFFESHFNASQKKRDYFHWFLHEEMPREIAEVEVKIGQ